MDKNLWIYVPTRGRLNEHQQLTMKYLHPCTHKRITYVCPQDEVQRLRSILDKVLGPRRGFVLARPCSIKNLSECRAWIMVQALAKGQRYIAQLDDDLDFYIRKTPGDWHLRYATPSEVSGLFDGWLAWLRSGYSHVGVSLRQNNNRMEDPTLVQFCTKSIMAMANDLVTMDKRDCHWGRLQLMSDYDVTLQLLRAGHPNVVTFRYAVGHRSSNQPGGCSVYRTPATLAMAAEGLARLHPGFVKVEEKHIKGQWFKGPVEPRKDVRVAWQRAYLSSGQPLPDQKEKERLSQCM